MKKKPYNKRLIYSNRVKIIYITYPVVCKKCGWKGKRIEANMVKPCPICQDHTVVRRTKTV